MYWEVNLQGMYKTLVLQAFLSYNIYVGEDPKKSHLHAVTNFLGKPTGTEANNVKKDIYNVQNFRTS